MGKIIAFIGPSGAGKTTLVDMLDLPQVVSVTTRRKRPHEVDGADYLFLTKEFYEQLLAGNHLAEHVNNYGDYYGVTKSSLDEALSSSTTFAIIITYEGYKIIRDYVGGNNIYSIFIYTPKNEIETRLRQRLLTDETEKIAKRLASYEEELKTASNCDFMVPSIEGFLDKAFNTVKFIIDKL